MGTIGIEWVNSYNGRASDLKNNDDNARGFLNTLQGVKRFDYGDGAAWDRDFEQSGAGAPAAGTDQIYADAVDVVFFSGHGSTAGALFGVTSFDDGEAKPSEMRLGDQDCEWVVFDACQVLEDDGAVFSRLWDMFTGLHYVLGFHTICQDVGDRGRKLAERLNSGWRVRDAWIAACTETEGSDRQWAYMRALQPGTDTFEDHWHGKGSVSPDPSTPTTRAYLRGSC